MKKVEFEATIKGKVGTGGFPDLQIIRTTQLKGWEGKKVKVTIEG